HVCEFVACRANSLRNHNSRGVALAYPCSARLIRSMETRPLESSSQIVREQVRRRYGATARGETSSCGDGCCSSTSADVLGYSAEESALAPEGANLGLGCGNPLAIASLRAGKVALDLGAGAGLDCLLADRAVGSYVS